MGLISSSCGGLQPSGPKMIWTDGLTDEQTDGRPDRQTNGQTDEQTDGRTDRWTERRTDGRFKGVRFTKKCIYKILIHKIICQCTLYKFVLGGQFKESQLFSE